MTPTPASAEALDAAWRLFRRRTGFGNHGIRRAQLEQGTRRAMERAGIDDYHRYASLLATDPSAVDDLVEELVIGETYFFREPQHCQALRDEILPALRKARGRAPLRIWSAGCASGEEPYTLAILLAEMGEANAKLFATDIARGALERARGALYRRWSLRTLDEPTLRRYFEREGEGFRLRAPYREQVAFTRMNLVSDLLPPTMGNPPCMDLIFCRNLLIYFDQDTVRHVARRLWASLAEGGWLVTGSSDPPLQHAAPFTVEVRPQGVFYRRLAALAAVATPKAAPAPIPVAPAPTPTPLPAPPPAALDDWLTALTAAAKPGALPSPAGSGPRETLASARGLLQKGAYAAAIDVAETIPTSPDAAALRIRAIANRDGTREARAACDQALAQHPFSTELHYLMAALLLADGRDEESLSHARRVIYLDRSLALGHLLYASVLQRLGETRAAAQAYAVADRLAGGHNDGEPVPLADEQDLSWSAVRAAARAQIVRCSREGHA